MVTRSYFQISQLPDIVYVHCFELLNDVFLLTVGVFAPTLFSKAYGNLVCDRCSNPSGNMTGPFICTNCHYDLVCTSSHADTIVPLTLIAETNLLYFSRVRTTVPCSWVISSECEATFSVIGVGILGVKITECCNDVAGLWCIRSRCFSLLRISSVWSSRWRRTRTSTTSTSVTRTAMVRPPVGAVFPPCCTLEYFKAV